MKTQSKTIMLLPWRRPSFFLVFILQLVTCSLWGQVMQKKNLTVNDYPKWGELYPEKLSPDGQWVSYSMNYENGLDTLFIKNTKSIKKYAFPLANKGKFITPDWFTYKTATGLQVLNLNTGKQETIVSATKDVYAPITKQLLVLVTEKGKESTLLIGKPGESASERIAGVTDFVMDPTKQFVLYTTIIGNQHTITLMDLSKKSRKTILFSGSGPFSNLVWHKKGKALVFMQTLSDALQPNTIFFYNLSSKKLYHSNTETQRSFLRDSLFIPTSSYKLKISDDLQSIFFAVQQKTISNDSIKGSDVQLWNGNAKWIYPTEEQQKKFKGIYLALWRPQEDFYRLISNDTLPQFMLTGDQHNAIISNTKQYEPQYMREGPRDFYLVDLSSGKSELILKKHSDHFLFTIPSPDGKYIAYFKQKDWWIYDITKKSHTNITKNIGQSFSYNKKELPQDEQAYQNLGWTLHDKEILLCDQYDLWAISPDGITARRLTHGKETQTQFRLAGYSQIILGKLNYDGWILDAVDLNKGLLLEATDKKGGIGYYKWSPKANDKIVFCSSSRLSEMKQSASGDTFVYLEQRYDLSPRLIAQTHTDKTHKTLIQSNPQQQQFYWGKEELIHYKNAEGKSLQGILYYPAAYDKLKKYPMIVHVYEKFSHTLYTYTNPSQFSSEGFNISNYITQGYFVLLPDISYKIGNPGSSATDCVVAATNEIIAKGLVQPDKIGLIGHSMGGYETDFIITQTNLFATAVAGAAVTDFSSHYLSVGLFGKPLLWRFENHQMRMEKSLFEDRAGYTRNSPIEHVKNITTPLLSWTGDADQNVNWTQSVEFYLALRRLEKKHIMLVYPKEEHDLSIRQNQQDLSSRILQWFDYHLKDVPVTWVKAGLK